jgi:hypothetical protein
MNNRLINIIVKQTEYEEQEWETRDLKEAKQMLKDAIQYQQYWTERGHTKRYRDEPLPTKFTVYCGIFTRASLSIGLIQARKLLEGYWKDGLDNAERDLENGYDTAENEFSIEIDEYSIQFKVKVEKTGQHINQAKWDKVSEFRESVFSEEEE